MGDNHDFVVGGADAIGLYAMHKRGGRPA